MSNSALRYQQNYPQSKKKRSRQEKQANNEAYIITDKFQEERKEEVKSKPLIPMSEKQKRYLELLRDPDVHIIVATGLFGTGKTFLPSAHAADLLRLGHIDKIIVARPYVQTGKTSGSKPGTSLEKLRPYVRTMLDTMQQRLGYNNFNNLLKDGCSGKIEVQELESIRGRSFDEKSWLILDESQQCDSESLLSVVTRVSDNCKLVLCGDLAQRDIKGQSGLKWFLDFAKRHNIKGIETVDFNSVDDIVRGGIVKGIAIGLKKDTEKGIYTPQKQ